MEKRHAEFEVKSWDENTEQELDDGGKLTRAVVKTAIHGDIEGEGEIEYLMAYRPDGTATFVAQERITGTIGNRRGSFVVHHKGTYNGKKARSTWQIVRKSATGELAGLKGKGKFEAPSGSTGQMDFEYDLEQPRNGSRNASTAPLPETRS
jgi:hypothetical protein